MRVYLDNAATTAIDPQVVATMTDALQRLYGNPSSIHADGRAARAAIEDARKRVARLIGAGIGEVFFTSGGTESNNMVLKNAVRDLGVKRIISSQIEHHAVLHTLENLQKTKDLHVDFVVKTLLLALSSDRIVKIYRLADGLLGSERTGAQCFKLADVATLRFVIGKERPGFFYHVFLDIHHPCSKWCT